MAGLPGGSRAATILGLDHVQIAAPADCEVQAREFFGGLLGLQEIEKPAALSASGGVWFRCGAAELHVGVEQPFQPAGKAHPALLVDPLELDRLAQRLRAAGVEVRRDERLPGVERFYARDPWGNRIELTAGQAAIAFATGPADLAGALDVRERVFCGEQGVPVEEERDGRDDEALHLVARAPGGGEVVGTLRLLFDGDAVKVGRVAVDPRWRRRGIAARMLAIALEAAVERGARTARLAAQVDATDVYRGAGFEVVSERFVEAGIPHVWMARKLPEASG